MEFLRQLFRERPLLIRWRFERVRKNIEAVEGWLVSGQEYWLFSTAWGLRDGARIVEIGSYKGRSTLSLAFACVGTNKRVFSIDRWRGIYQDIIGQQQLYSEFEMGFFDIWQQNVFANNLQDIVTPLVGDSSEIAKIWRAPIDMIFVDGSHQYEDVVADFENYYPYVKPGGIMVFHDVTPAWDGCWRAWHEHIAPRLSNINSFSTISYGYKS